LLNRRQFGRSDIEQRRDLYSVVWR